jgi:hypothetical protein
MNCARVPKKAIEIIKAAIERTGSREAQNFILSVNDPDRDFDLYLSNSESDVLWAIYLLHRLGGRLKGGGKEFTIRRARNGSPPLLLLQPISGLMRDAANTAMGCQYEHYISSKAWQVLGKELEEVNLMVLVIESKFDDAVKFMGLLDKETARILFERIRSGVPIERALQLDYRTSP